MNDKIKQLAKQAEQYVNNAMDERANNKDFTFVDIDEMYNTKFAKLIVRECMACSTWVGKMNTNSSEPIQTAHAINQRIKQQFGVEE